MKKFLKKYFIPHKDNDYKPHFFREGSLLTLTFVILIVFSVAVAGQYILKNTDLVALVLPKVLVDEANKDRLASNFHPLTVSPVLERAAQMKADDMATKGYFAHKSPEGKTPWYWFLKAGYDFSYAGENLAINFTESADVNTAWMNSPTHRQNILNGNFNEIGIATAQGTYNGKTTIFVAELFGRRAAVEIPQSVSKNNIKTISKATTTPKVISVVASSSVLGATGENDLYIAVERKSAIASTNYSGSYASWLDSWLDKMLLSPGKILSYVYLLLALIITIGLLLKISIEIRKQHPKYLIMSVMVLCLMVLLLYLYKYVIFGPTIIA